MTETIEPMVAQIDQQQLAQDLVEKARAEGVELVGPGGLLSDLTKSVLETALEAELSEHLGYDKHEAAGRNRGNSRNGTRSKTVLTEIGSVEIEVPRDRDGTFEPAIVRKRQRRLDGIDQIVLSLTARGLTTGEISAHLCVGLGADPECSAGRQQLAAPEVAQSGSQLVRCGDDEVVELVQSNHAGLIRAPLQQFQRPQCLDRTVVRLGHGGGLASQHCTSRGNGVDDIALAVSATDLTAGSRHLDDTHRVGPQVLSQSRPIAAGALDPDSVDRTVSAQPIKQLEGLLHG